MEQLRLNNTAITLVNHVEDRVLSYLSEHDFKLGDKLPSEHELAVSLGVTRSVVREALSRLKMLGIVESRTRRGMVLKEPSIFGGMKRAIRPNLMSEKSLVNLLGFRVALEVGITGYIFENITPADIKDLEESVYMEIALGDNIYANISEHRFHSKLYEITRNSTISQFQEIIYPVMEFVKSNLKTYVSEINSSLQERGELVTHQDLLRYLKAGDENGYRKAIDQHFFVYKELIRNNNSGYDSSNYRSDYFSAE